MPAGMRRAAVTARMMQTLIRAPSPRVRLPATVIDRLFSARRYASRLRLERRRVSSVDLPYLIGGAGEPVVLLHGFGDNKDSFVDTVRDLTRRHTVVLPDLPGFGDALAPPGFEFTLHGFARVIGGLIDAVGLGPVHLGGNSLGGAVSAALALERPELVRSLTLIGSAGVQMPRPSALQRRMEAGDNPFVIESFEEYEALMRFVLERPPPIPWPIRRHLADGFIARAELHQQIMENILAGQWDLTEELDRIGVPALALWGDRDRLIDVSAGRVFHERLPRSRLVIFHGVGHCPQYEVPERTGSLVERFLASG